MPITFIDASSLIHAAKAGLGTWEVGQPFPASADRFLNRLFLNGERMVINDLILDEVARGSAHDDGFLENWLREQVRLETIEIDYLSAENREIYGNISNGGEQS